MTNCDQPSSKARASFWHAQISTRTREEGDRCFAARIRSQTRHPQKIMAENPKSLSGTEAESAGQSYQMCSKGVTEISKHTVIEPGVVHIAAESTFAISYIVGSFLSLCPQAPVFQHT